jgi:hypothetical protein
MATNLQVGSNISSTPQYIQDASANNSSLSISNANIGIGTNSPTTEVQIMKGATDCRLQVGTYSTGATSDRSALQLLKSGSNTPGTTYRTVDGEDIGNIEFFGANTSDAGAKAAAIEVEQDGAGGATYIPGRITLLTGTNAAAPSARVTIKNDGKVGIGTTAPSVSLHVAGDALVVGSDGWAGAGNKATLHLGDTTYPKVYAVYGGGSPTGGLYFSTRDASDHIFQWTNHNGDNLVVLRADSGRMGFVESGPDSALHIAQNAGGLDKGYITLESLDSNGTPADDDQLTVYAKGTKIVMAMKVSGTVRYTSIDMGSSGNSWSTSSTTAP